MSLAERVPWERAMDAAKALIAELEIPEALIAGSLRRRAPMVGDIELVVPLPGDFFNGCYIPTDPPARDRLLEHLERRFTPVAKDGTICTKVVKARQGLLVDAITAPYKPEEPPALITVDRPLGKAIKGVKPGFRYCQLELPLTLAPKTTLKVDIFRYVPGPHGNRGWIELIRTGPAELGQKACARWKYISKGGWSDQGFPHRSDGTRLAVPTERDAFDLLGWDWVEPENRR